MGLFRRKPSVDPAQVAAVAAEVAAVRVQLEQISRRLDAADGERGVTRELVTALQQRVASIGTELTNQLTELSGDIDALQQRPDPAPLIATVDGLVADIDTVRTDVGAVSTRVDGVAADVDGMRTGQERLANEQARYQIAFRDDLAAIAEQASRKRA